jgi:hypothetical protein
VRLTALTVALVALMCASAAAVFEPTERIGDLDGDMDNELVRAVDPDGRGERTQVNISDECDSGGATDRRVAGPEESLASLKLVRADLARGSEVFVELRSGASGRNGQARVVAWRPRSETSCRRPRYLFRYESRRPSRPPRGASEYANFAAAVRNVTRRYRGREVLLDELYVTRRLPAGCCPSYRKRRYFRYSVARDRYVVYRTRLKRLRTR